jgi:hypothetical protein
MMRDPTTPCAWANMLVTMWGARFPVKVEQIALEYSTRFDDKIHSIQPADIDTFEGTLAPLRKKGGWAILYNSSIASKGRINFTLGHEFGHYLVHRGRSPDGFQCGASDVYGEASAASRRLMEQEADQFASYLLMPLNDFRDQIGRNPMSLDLLRHCADRYDVSLTAAALKWLDSTSTCAAVVVATNGYVLWCRRSRTAQKARIFFEKGMELPAASAAAQGPSLIVDSKGTSHSAGVWLPHRGAREMAIFADRYEMTISLLVFDDIDFIPPEFEDEEPEDSFDRFEKLNRRED